MADTRTQIQARYDAKNRKTITLKLNYNYDGDIIETLEKQESVNGYIKEAIREKITRTRTDFVNIQLSNTVLDILKKESARTGLSVPELIRVIVNEQAFRIEKNSQSVPKNESEEQKND